MAPDSAAHLALVRDTARLWDIDAVDVTLASHSENLVYRVRAGTGEQVAVRLHRPGYHSLVELDSERLWTAALNDAGVNVPIGRPTPAGDFYREVILPDDTRRYAGVVDWLEGVSLMELMETLDDPVALAGYYRTVGGLAAKIHDQASTWQVPDQFARHHLDAAGFMGEAPFWGSFWDLPELSTAERQLIQRVRKTLYDRLSALDCSADVYSMIHADLHTGNLLVNGDRITVIDFDDAGFGWHMYEMAVALFWHADGEHAQACFDAYVDGYRAERYLSAEMLALYPVFHLVRGLASLGWIHHRREHERPEVIRRLIDLVCRESTWLLAG